MRRLQRSVFGVDSNIRDDRHLHLSHVIAKTEAGNKSAEQFEGAVCRKDCPERRAVDTVLRKKEYWPEV